MTVLIKNGMTCSFSLTYHISPCFYRKQYKVLQKIVRSVSKEIVGLMKKERKNKGVGEYLCPKGVILYFEGLDCSGKSSTGGLVQAALEQAGYEVGMRQYNRPPTAEQR